MARRQTSTPPDQVDVAYLRTSSLEQRRRETIRGQRSEVERYLEYAQLADVLWLADDGVAGDLPFEERPDGQRLLTLLADGRVRTLVVRSIDRLGRSALEILRVVDSIREAEARLVSLKENIDLATPTGSFFVNILAAFAELERSWIRDRTQNGRRRRVEEGKLIPTGARPLYGYRWRGETREALDLDPDAAEVVRRIFTAAADGRPIRAIAAELMAAAIPSPRGAAVWRPQTLRNILRHPHYTGVAHGWRHDYRTVRGKGYKRSYLKPAEEWIALPEGTVPAIVSEATWDAVQDQLVRNKAHAARNNREPEATLLRGGYARCALCGGALRIRRWAGPDGTPRWPAYQCQAEPPCRVVLSATRLDAWVWGHVRALVLDPERLTAEGKARIRPTRVADSPALDRRILELERQERNVADQIATYGASSALHAKALELEERRRALEAQRADALTRSAATERDQRVRQDFVTWCRAAAERIDAAGYDERRRALDATNVRVKVWPREHTPRAELRFGPPGGEDIVLTL